MRVAFAAIWLLLLSTWGAHADPTIPLLTGRVVDLADILTAANERDLTNQLAAIEAKTGAQIVVAVLPSLNGYPIESWGLALGRKWGIGHKGRDDGIVIVLAPNDREVRIEVGYGLEGRVPDAIAHRIIQTYMLPAARERRYAKGLEATIAALERVIVDPKAVPKRQSAVHFGEAGFIFLFGGLAFFAIFVLMLCRSFGSPTRTDEQSTSTFADDEDNSFSSSSGSSSSGRSSFGGRGGSFGGGGASGRW